MQYGAVKIPGKKKIAAAADVKMGFWQSIEINLRQNLFRVIFHKAVRLDLHPEGIGNLYPFLYHSLIQSEPHCSESRPESQTSFCRLPVLP